MNRTSILVSCSARGVHGQIAIGVCHTRRKVFAVRARGYVYVPVGIEVTHVTLGVVACAEFVSSGYTGCPINYSIAAPFDVETQ